MKDAGTSEFIPIYVAALAVLMSVAPVHAAGSNDAQAIAEQFAKDGAEADAKAKRAEQARVEAAKKEFDAKRAEAQRRFEEQKKKEAEKKQADAERKALEDREVNLIEEMLKKEDERRLAEETALKKAEEERLAAEQRKADEPRRLAAEAEAKRQGEETARKQAETERVAVEQRKQQELAEAKKAEEQKRLAAETEAKRLADDKAKAEAKRVAEEAARKQAEAERLTAEAKKAEEQKRLATEAEVKRLAEEARAATAQAEAKKAAEEIRNSSQAQTREDARRQAEDARLAAEEERLKQERVAAEQRNTPAAEQREKQATEKTGVPAAPERQAAATQNTTAIAKPDELGAPDKLRQRHVTLILRLEHPSASDGARRFRNEFTVDPIACFGETCYVGRGSSEAAKQTTVERALSPGNVLGLRAGACNKTLLCIYRSIELPPGAATLQPIDINVINHDFLLPRLLKADASCRIEGTSLKCDGGLFTHEYSAWIVPESVAERAGPKALEDALNVALPKARQAYAVRTLGEAQPKLGEIARLFHDRVLHDQFSSSCFSAIGPLSATFDLAFSSLGMPPEMVRFGGMRVSHRPNEVLEAVATSASPARLESLVAEEPQATWRILRGIEQLRALGSADTVEAASPSETLKIAAEGGKVVLQVGAAVRARAQSIVAACSQRASRHDGDGEGRRERGERGERERHWWRR